MKAVPYWMGLAFALCAEAWPAEPPAQPPPAAPAPPVQAAGDAPDDELIEFLGADDVGDAAWWEFLKKSTTHKGQAPVPPPQDARQ